MWRKALTWLLAVTVTALGVAPAGAQFAPAYGQSAPQYQQSAPQYEQPGPDSQAQAQYPQGPYAPPYAGGPQGSYAQPQYPQGSYSQAPQGAYPQADQDAPNPTTDRQHGVARLSIVQGDVSVKLGATGELVAAAVNAPLVAQDHVQTTPGSRAEVELDSSNLIRLAPNTDLGFADLEYHRYQAELGAGTIIYRVLRDSDAQSEVDTPSIAFRPLRQGEYRIAVLDDGTTQITVRQGQAEILSPRGSQSLDAGHTTLVRGNPSDPEFQSAYEVTRDQFDDWSANRDRELLTSQSYNYVNRDDYGADDLDAYGNWVPSQYGQVWAPRPPSADWAPYSQGQWTYVDDYYGWSWVDSAPWGWAPYHYGRWFWNTGYGWCWWPGARFGLSLWSPALVGFFGWGGAGLGLWAGLGWVALAPFEALHAWWGHGFYNRGGFGFAGRFGTGYGMVRGANLAAMYRNAAIRGGAMTTAFNRFGGPGQRFSPATRAQLSSASLFRGGVPVSANRGSFQFANRAAIANPRLASAANRQFFHSSNFAGSRFGSAGAGAGRFGAPSNSFRGAAPNVQRPEAGRNGYGAASSGSGWQRFGAPGNSNSFRQSFNGQESSGWHSFGEPQRSAPANRTSGPSYGPSYNAGRNYQSRPFGGNPSTAAPRSGSSGYSGYSGGYSGGRSAFTAPRYSAPAAPHYSAPSQPHYSAPSSHSGGGGGGGSHGGGGSSHGGGGGGHSSSGGHRGR